VERCSIVVVEHDMEFVSALSGDKGIVTVLAEGSVLAQGTMSQIKNDPAVIESYLRKVNNADNSKYQSILWW
jgi:urea transport system ATP-binding protein